MTTASSITGLVFNIQKFSLDDGPGIRTVVFLKGCPLKCAWCANPESQSPNVTILWDSEKCLHCGACVQACPNRAVYRGNDAIIVDHSRCKGCRKCVEACPAQALKSEGDRKTVEEVVDICMQDVPFYEESGGGVTLSGGEALMQFSFTIALLKALKGKGIHTTIETSGYASASVFSQVLPYIDLVLFDIKHYDEHKHIVGTGVSNSHILKNMKMAVSLGKEVLPRLPVIPGYNDSLSDARGFVRRLKEIGVSRVQLLPFHQFGEKKYDMMNLYYEYADVPALHEEDLRDYQQVFIDNGIHAFF